MTTQPYLWPVDSGDAWWLSGARRAVETLAHEGRDFTVEDLRALGVPEPEHPNQWGPVFRDARRRGLIAPVGFTTTTRTTRHGAPVRVWRGVRAAA